MQYLISLAVTSISVLLLALTLTCQASLLSNIASSATASRAAKKGGDLAINAMVKRSENPETKDDGSIKKQMAHLAVSMALNKGTDYLNVVAPETILARPFIKYAAGKVESKIHRAIDQFGDLNPQEKYGEKTPEEKAADEAKRAERKKKKEMDDKDDDPISSIKNLF